MISKSLIAHLSPKSPVAEAYRMLRTNLHFLNVDKEIKTIIVTSPSVAEGKSTTISNLAISLAHSGKKVLLMDCDLRKPKIHKYFRRPNNLGVTNILVDEENAEYVIKKISEIENLNILTSGNIPPDPSELLNSKKMKILLNTLKEKYDIILIDSPPICHVTDSTILAGIVDGVILVLSSAETNIETAKHAKRTLDNIKAKVLGVVMTKIDKKSLGYKYYYKDYGYYNK